ncbi:MAG: hypothetical protein ACT4OV_05700 [Microthrixaceae bacterium]
MRRWGLRRVLPFLVVLAACGGGGSAAAPTTRESSDTTTTTAPLDQSRFCVAIRALEALGTAPAASGGGPTEVLGQNAQLAGLIEEAAANLPKDAPGDVAVLLADYRAISEAVSAAKGDRDAAIAALTAAQPALMARVSTAGAHKASFSFFADRCGTAPPT